MRDIYQKLYETTIYGRVANNRCPSYRHLDIYEKWLKSPICDLGCGSGDTVKYLKKFGYDIDGYDFIDLDNGMIVADITKPLDLLRYKTAICFDVIEHLTDEQLKVLFENLKQCPTKILSVHNASSVDFGVGELHINIKELKKWDAIINKEFIITDKIYINDHYRLYKCQGNR